MRRQAGSLSYFGMLLLAAAWRFFGVRGLVTAFQPAFALGNAHARQDALKSADTSAHSKAWRIANLFLSCERGRAIRLPDTEDRLEACPTLGCVVLALTLLALVGCGQSDDAQPRTTTSSKPIVISANYPLHSFAQRIGGETIEAVFLVPMGVDPADWEPTPDDIISMQQADLILLNGAGYEKWLSTISLPESKLVDTSAGFTDQYIREESGATHQHGPGGEHTHGEIAFTTWLDLSLAIQQAQAVERALAQLVPDKSARFAGNLAALTNELESIDRDLLAWGESMKGQPLITSHPVYQYFARRYGLNVKSVHWEPDDIPDAAAWRELDVMLKEHPAKLMIWEGEPDRASVEELQRRGLDSKVFVPCANVVDDGDFPDVMWKNALNIRN